MFWKQAKIQWRVIGALLIREIYARFGREGLGFAWLIAEPLMFAIPVLLLWSVVRAHYEHGVPLMSILVTGYMAILLFRHLGGSMLLFIRGNANLLYHRQIGLLDIFVARALVEILSNIMALAVVLTIFVLLGKIEPPANLSLFYLGYFFMIWWSVAVAMLVGALTERSQLMEKIWPVYSYTYLFFSGFFYIADWLPPKVRAIALYQPSLQAYEIMRSGMFGHTVKTYGDPAYTTIALAVLTLLGLWAMHEARREVVLR